MKVISIVNQKGGVGKSTIACNLAVASALDGNKTLLIDADPQGSSIAFRGLRESSDITAVAITTPTVHTDIHNFKDFDLIIIDAGGRDNTLFRSSMVAAKEGILLVPVLPSIYDVWATEDTFSILKELRISMDIDCYTLFNQNTQRTTNTKEAHQVLQEISEENNVKILKSILDQRVDYKNSIAQGKGVLEYSPGSKAAIEIENLYQELKTILGL